MPRRLLAAPTRLSDCPRDHRQRSRDLPTAPEVSILDTSATLTLLEQNFEFDLLTQEKLLEKSVGEMVKVIHSPEFKKRMDEIGAEPVGNSSEQMGPRSRARPTSSRSWSRTPRRRSSRRPRRAVRSANRTHVGERKGFPNPLFKR